MKTARPPDAPVGGRLKGTFYVLICVALWALIPVVAKQGQLHLDNHQFLFWSSLVSFAVLTGSAWMSGQLRQIVSFSAAEWYYLLSLGLLGTYIYYLFLYLGYARAAGMEVLVVQYSWPILIVLLSIFILKEELTLRKSIALLLGFFGVVTVLTRGAFAQIQLSNSGVILLVGLGAFCFALFSVLSKSVRREPLAVVSIYFLAATIASFCSMMYFSGFALPDSSEIGPVLINGVLVNGFSYLFWLLALRATAASYLAPFIFLAPLISAIYLVLFFHEPFLWAYAVGLVLVLSAGLVNSLGGPET